MLCATCGVSTDADPCATCGRPARLDGRYVLEAVLGQGAIGTTYAARTADGERVAIKEVPLRRAQDDKVLELLHREAAVLRQLDHPAIPRYVEDLIAGEGKHRALYVVQELIEGRSLQDELPDRRYDQHGVLEVMAGILRVLVYLHELVPPVVHRDLKPGNIMRRPDGSLALVDFGAVRDSMRDLDFGGSTVAGTFGYMPPEQFAGDALPQSDLYAVGAVAIALVTRVEPKTLLDRQGTLHWRGKVALHPAFEQLLADLLEPDPERRPGSASEVLRRVTEVRARIARRKATPTSPPRAERLRSVEPPPDPPRAERLSDVQPLRMHEIASGPSVLPPPPKRGPPIAPGLLALALGLVGVVIVLGQLSADGTKHDSVVANARFEPAQAPLPTLRLAGLELGMQWDQAVAALPGLAESEALPPDQVQSLPLDLDFDALMASSAAAEPIPGEHRKARALVRDEPSTCELWFAVDDRLSRIRCRIDPLPDPNRHEALLDATIRELERDFGIPTRQAGGSGREWSWHGTDATLVVSANAELATTFGLDPELGLDLQSREHERLLKRLEEQARERLAAERARVRAEEEATREAEREALRR